MPHRDSAMLRAAWAPHARVSGQQPTARHPTARRAMSLLLLAAMALRLGSAVTDARVSVRMAVENAALIAPHRDLAAADDRQGPGAGDATISEDLPPGVPRHRERPVEDPCVRDRCRYNGIGMHKREPSLFAADQPDRSPARSQATRIPERRQYQGPPTSHVLNLGDARALDWIADASVHLVVTSPPYFNLKKYNEYAGQLGDLHDYDAFHDELDKAWRHCFRVLLPGGRLVCNVGDVCVARRANRGRHLVLPLHADIAVRARRIGFDYLTPILWHKIANAQFEASGNGAGFLGKPYEPNAIIKNDVEYLLMLRKPGQYRSPSNDQRATSRLTKEEQARWFRPFWSDITGASTREHPAPFPVELAYRLVRMFSFTGDTVLDPFAGSGTTTIAAMMCDRNSIGNEIDPEYFRLAERRLRGEIAQGRMIGDSPTLTVRTSR